MVVWGELREALVRLLAEQPDALRAYPGVDRDEGAPPYYIELAAWAEEAAAGLDRQFGDQVHLTVGALPYPPGRAPRRPRRPQPEPAPLLGADEAEAELDGPAVVRSGYELRHGLLVRDRSGAGLAVATSGQVTGSVVDLATGDVVGGWVGWVPSVLVTFRVPPGGIERIPLLIGTASTTERLGYAVPPGEWGVQATLDLMPDEEPPYDRERIQRRTPVRPLTITA
ncbi:MAG TPA: hypothetical protein VFV73_13490 [Streptosporangiaceae bacterium]|nr:hypothetical protein [Streptosporangiaceae bacterium]